MNNYNYTLWFWDQTQIQVSVISSRRRCAFHFPFILGVGGEGLGRVLRALHQCGV